MRVDRCAARRGRNTCRYSHSESDTESHTYLQAADGTRDAKYSRELRSARVSDVPSDSNLFIHCGVCEEPDALARSGKLGRWIRAKARVFRNPCVQGTCICVRTLNKIASICVQHIVSVFFQVPMLDFYVSFDDRTSKRIHRERKKFFFTPATNGINLASFDIRARCRDINALRNIGITDIYRSYLYWSSESRFMNALWQI